MPCCSAFGCSNRSDITDRSNPVTKKTYHKFPSDPVRLQQWLINIKRENFTPSKYSTLCSDHFEEWCFDKTGQIVRLRENAIPTIFSFFKREKRFRKRTFRYNEVTEEPSTKTSKLRVTKGKAIRSKNGRNCRDHAYSNEELLPKKDPDLASPAVIKNEIPDKTEFVIDDPDSIQIAKMSVQMANKHGISLSATTEGQTKNGGKKAVKGEKGLKARVFPYSKKKPVGKDKITRLPDNRIYFQFATPKSNVIFQLKPAKQESHEIKSQSLEEIISSLRSRDLISHEAQTLLESFGRLPQGLIRIDTNRYIRGLSKEQIKEVEKISSVLFVYAPKAYKLLLTIFKLPDDKILHERLKVKNYWPGFTREALNLLKNRILRNPRKNVCSIMFSFIDINKQLSLDGSGRWIGHIDFAAGPNPKDVDEIPLATKLLMFTIVGLGHYWKLPFGYFMTTGLNGSELHSLVTQAIQVVEECGLSVRALVCEGTKSCVTMGKIFGCNIDARSSTEITTSFPHPIIQKKKIYLIFSIQHGLQLLQNLLRDKGTLRSSVYGIINWKFFSQLYREGEGTLTHLLEQEHTEFYKLLKVTRLCKPAFNRTVSHALEIAIEDGLEEFAGSRPAANFAADLHRAFSLLDSRNGVLHGEKHPISLCFLAEQLETMSLIGQRLFDLELPSGEPIIDGNRWMSVVMFAFTLKSVANLASELLKEKILPFVATCRLNLDHSDMLYSCIQELGGWDGVPSASEFREGYKKLMSECFQISALNGNYTNDLEGEALTVGQGMIYPVCKPGFDRKFHNMFKSYPYLDLISENEIRARFIIRSVAERISCPECVKVLLDDDSACGIRNKTYVVCHINPSVFVRTILQISESISKRRLLESRQISKENLVLNIFYEYVQLKLIMNETVISHVMEEPYHIISLIKTVIRTYINCFLPTKRYFTALNWTGL